MDISKIGHGENPDAVKAIIEVPYGSNVKYELDKESGAIEVDRVMYSAMFYPANYGFVANTLSDDGDPADILVISECPLYPGSFIKGKVAKVEEDPETKDLIVTAEDTLSGKKVHEKVNMVVLALGMEPSIKGVEISGLKVDGMAL